jgi:hypothetical protein
MAALLVFAFGLSLDKLGKWIAKMKRPSTYPLLKVWGS